MSAKKINVKLLRKIQKHILAEPKRFIMGDFIVRRSDRDEMVESDGLTTPFAACDTAACIAGWACLLSDRNPLTGFAKLGAELLGIEYIDPDSVDEEDVVPICESDRLFYTSTWPEEFARPFHSAKTREEKAAIAVQRIDHFLATKGAE